LKIYRIAEYYKRYYTLEIAGNPNTSPEILKKILEQGNNDLVSRIAASNPNCPVEALEMVLILEQGNNDLVSRCAVKNPNCPAYLLEMVLKRGNGDWVSQCAAENPNCPASALEMVLKRGKDDYVSWYAASNPNCPASALEMVLKRGKNDNVSLNASENPNCPALAKIRWMQATGKIGKEDPSKHIIEREEYKEDPDLQKLRDLIAKNNSWYKKAQAELLELDDLPNIENDSEDEGVERAKKYFGIGHGDFVEEFGYNPDFLIWIMIDGHIEKSKVFKVNQESGEAKGAQTHGTLWGNARDDNYRGRYEPQTGRLTLVKPENARFREVPKEIINRVENSFPKAKQIIIASNKNMYKVAKEEDVDLYLSREITRLGLDHPIFRQIPLYDIKDWIMRNDPELEKASSQSIDKIYEDYLREHPEGLQKPKQTIPVPVGKFKPQARAFFR